MGSVAFGFKSILLPTEGEEGGEEEEENEGEEDRETGGERKKERKTGGEEEAERRTEEGMKEREIRHMERRREKRARGGSRVRVRYV